MADRRGLVQVAVDHHPEGPFQTAPHSRLLDHKEAGLPCTAGPAETRGRVKRVQVRGDRKDYGDDLRLRQVVPGKQFVIEERGLFRNILGLVFALGRAPEGPKGRGIVAKPGKIGYIPGIGADYERCRSRPEGA
jgi:hypothetical protein